MLARRKNNSFLFGLLESFLIGINGECYTHSRKRILGHQEDSAQCFFSTTWYTMDRAGDRGKLGRLLHCTPSWRGATYNVGPPNRQ